MRIREGNTGVLALTHDDGRRETYIPKWDKDVALSLLVEFQNLRNGSQKSLKDNYWYDGFNWYPSAVVAIYHYILLNYVKYEELLWKTLLEGQALQFDNHANFSFIYHLVKNGGPSRRSFVDKIKNTILNISIDYHNRMIISREKARVLFHSFYLGDFRHREIQAGLDRLSVRYIQTATLESFKYLLHRMYKPGPVFIYTYADPSRPVFQYDYDVSNMPNRIQVLFNSAAKHINSQISFNIYSYKKHVRHLKNSKIDTYIGWEDMQRGFSLATACKKSGIHTVAWQHGAYVRRLPEYILYGLNEKDLMVYDRLLLWGQYWKDQLLRYSKAHRAERLVVGSCKMTYDYSTKHAPLNNPPRNILMPYEHLTNTARIGRYMARLMDKGFNVYFKPRPDENVEDQIDTYLLTDEYRRRLIVVESITAELMKDIDIVAGSMTNMIYELLPYNKIMWIFEEESKHLYDLVEQGYAHHLKLEDIEDLKNGLFKRTVVDDSYLFSSQSIEGVLRRELLSGPGGDKAENENAGTTI